MSNRETWAQRLREHCHARHLGMPNIQDVSDRRGGRTAWSTVIIIDNNTYPARFWYDGDHAQQAKEDAAEVALRSLTGCMDMAREPPPASAYRGVGVAGQGSGVLV